MTRAQAITKVMESGWPGEGTDIPESMLVLAGMEISTRLETILTLPKHTPEMIGAIIQAMDEEHAANGVTANLLKGSLLLASLVKTAL